MRTFKRRFILKYVHEMQIWSDTKHWFVCTLQTAESCIIMGCCMAHCVALANWQVSQHAIILV